MSAIYPEKSPSCPARVAQGARIVRNRPVRRVILYVIRRVFNPLTSVLAGRQYMPMFALIHHRGRRSGRWYATPAGARPTTDGFVIPLTFGDQSDWVRNVQAAGGAVIQYKGVKYPVVEPTVVDWATARSAFKLIERFVLPLLGIEHFARLQNAPPAAEPGLSASDPA
jgi:deazaflavin-dependent oxidoreductase (nitroreductase family)